MNVCIAGGGKVGLYLAQSLQSHRHKITIIEPDEEQCRLLADTLDSPVICGSSVSFDTLRTAEVDSCDAFVAVTGSDEDNLVACQIAKREFGVDRTVARVSNPKNRELLHTLGVDMVVCGTDNLSHILEREIETDTIRQLLTLGGGTASLNEILLPENFKFAGTAVKDVPIPGDAILVSITRDTEFILAPRQHRAAALGPHPLPDPGRHPAYADRGLGPGGQMTHQQLLRTALVIPRRGRALVCLWCAVPGAAAAPFAFYRSAAARGLFQPGVGGAGRAGLAAVPEFCRCPDPCRAYSLLRGLLGRCGAPSGGRRSLRWSVCPPRWPAGPGCGLSRCAALACGCSCLRWRQMPPRP